MNKTKNFSIKMKVAFIVISTLLICIAAGFIKTNMAYAKNENSLPTISDTITKGQPGVMTVENEIKTALMPVGKTLYIYGGGWNDNTTGKPVADYDANEETKTIGVPAIWRDFYLKQDSSYTPWDVDELDFDINPTCVHWGVDCAGYIGWMLQNLTNKEHGFNVETYGDKATGWVGYAQEIGYALSHLGYGQRVCNPKFENPDTQFYPYRDITKDPYISDSNVINNGNDYEYRPGDIFTFGSNQIPCEGDVDSEYHCWLCLGQCDDGSVLLVHSSDPGVFICGTVKIYDWDNPRNVVEPTQAYNLSSEYMNRYYSDFTNKFGVPARPFNDNLSDYCGYSKYSEFKWNESLNDDAGYRKMKPSEILRNIYCETDAGLSYTYDGQAATMKFNDALVEPISNSNQTVVYNRESELDETMKLSAEIPTGTILTSLKVNGVDYSAQIIGNKAVVTVPISNNYDIYTSTVAAPQPQPLEQEVYNTAQTDDFIYCYVWGIAFIFVSLFMFRRIYYGNVYTRV